MSLNINTVKKLILVGFCLITNCSFAQPAENWTKAERAYYRTIVGFCNYIESAPLDNLSKDTIFNNYFLFDYVLKDTSKERINARLLKFHGLLEMFRHNLDSMGLKNLDARPVRFYKKNPRVYEPFTEDDLIGAAPNSLAWYNKNDPDHPLGYLWFDDKNYKLISWILIDQGGTHYFLVFNML